MAITICSIIVIYQFSETLNFETCRVARRSVFCQNQLLLFVSSRGSDYCAFRMTLELQLC